MVLYFCFSASPSRATESWLVGGKFLTYGEWMILDDELMRRSFLLVEALLPIASRLFM